MINIRKFSIARLIPCQFKQKTLQHQKTKVFDVTFFYNLLRESFARLQSCSESTPLVHYNLEIRLRNFKVLSILTNLSNCKGHDILS